MSLPHLIHPHPSSVDVLPTTEVMVCFPQGAGRPFTIMVDDETVFVDGVLQPGFVETRRRDVGDHQTVGFRRTGGWPARALLVRAWVDVERPSRGERFFVRGAAAQAMAPAGSSGEVVQGDLGPWVNPQGRAFHDELRLAGCALEHPGYTYFVRPEWLLERTAARDMGDGGYVLVTTGRGRTRLLRPGWAHEFDFEADAVEITRGWIHLQYGPSRTLHAPWNHVFSPCERDPSAWWEFCHEGSWSMKFGHDLHVWHKPDAFIAKHRPDPMRAESVNVWWELADVRGVKRFESVEPLKADHVLINGEMVVDTRRGHVYGG